MQVWLNTGACGARAANWAGVPPSEALVYRDDLQSVSGVVLLLSPYLSSLVTVVNGVSELLIATIKGAGHGRASCWRPPSLSDNGLVNADSLPLHSDSLDITTASSSAATGFAPVKSYWWFSVCWCKEVTVSPPPPPPPDDSLDLRLR